MWRTVIKIYSDECGLRTARHLPLITAIAATVRSLVRRSERRCQRESRRDGVGSCYCRMGEKNQGNDIAALSARSHDSSALRTMSQASLRVMTCDESTSSEFFVQPRHRPAEETPSSDGQCNGAPCYSLNATPLNVATPVALDVAAGLKSP
jgi:hypothetical protein